ncbi:MAG TPA: trigger factor [Candidatus Saccharimonadales bacterium]|nr:trigger factor [Candidatus Saccharimonadales bacterium]
MNVTVENLAPCKKLVRFELDAKSVDDAFDKMAKDFIKEASLPGFRPGKAPKDMVLKKYEKEISDEVKKKLIGDTFRQGVKDQKIEVVGVPDLEEIQFARGQSLQFAATVETAPDFEVPEYRGLPARREIGSVTETDLQDALEALQGQQAKFDKVDRPVKQGDYVVVSYTGTSDGKPLTIIAPNARGLTEQKNFWVEVKPDSFIPGFAMQLEGAKAGEKRTVNIDFPADFVTPELAGKKATYDVEVVEVKERNLPSLDDAFAKSYGAENLEKLREGVRSDLQNELNSRQKRSIRGQIVKELLGKMTFDLPETQVQQETRNVVYEIVSENQKRGIPKEVIDKQKDEIFNASTNTAKERVKASYVFQKIADKEGIRVSREELQGRIAILAQNYQMTPQKFMQELEKRDGLSEIYQQMVHEKVVDYLQEHAKIEDVQPPAEAKA